MGMLNYFSATKSGSGFAAFMAILLALGLAIVVGYIMKTKFLKLGFMILGGVGGFFLGSLLYSLLLVELSSSIAVMWCTILFFMIIGACLGYKFESEIVILSTSFIGSYIFVRGFSIFIGGYPNEIQMMNDIQTGTA